MRRLFLGCLLLAVLGGLGSFGGISPAWGWRSSLYPTTWKPGWKDPQGRFLHDFSYAGYHTGAKPIPASVPGNVVDVTKAPYNADKTGATDVTTILQKALNDVGTAGGGVVYLPAGTYLVRPPAGKDTALLLRYRGVILRGAGPTQTFLYNDSADMRDKRIISVRPVEANDFIWSWTQENPILLTQDLRSPSLTTTLADVSSLKVGDWVVVRSDATKDWLTERGMVGTWPENGPEEGPLHYRRIDAIDPATKTVTFNIPTRHPLLMRDRARFNRMPQPHLEEVGLESFAIGNRASTKSGSGSSDWEKPGTMGYEVHASFAIVINHTVNAWIRDVKSYRPTASSQNVHLLSNGIRVQNAHQITVERVTLGFPQYKGAGGNGYMFVLSGSDSLFRDCVGEDGRHNFSFSFPQTTGNVIFRSVTRNGSLPVDYHQRFSLGNLIDSMTVENDFLSAIFRDCCGHGHAASESVFWNTKGLSYQWKQILQRFIIESQQWGQGYIIGTQGAATLVRTPGGWGADPVDFVEGIGQGATLEPASVFLDQVALRLGPPPGQEKPPAERPPVEPPKPDASLPEPQREPPPREVVQEAVRPEETSQDKPSLPEPRPEPPRTEADGTPPEVPPTQESTEAPRDLTTQPPADQAKRELPSADQGEEPPPGGCCSVAGSTGLSMEFLILFLVSLLFGVFGRRLR